MDKGEEDLRSTRKQIWLGKKDVQQYEKCHVTVHSFLSRPQCKITFRLWNYSRTNMVVLFAKQFAKHIMPRFNPFRPAVSGR